MYIMVKLVRGALKLLVKAIVFGLVLFIVKKFVPYPKEDDVDGRSIIDSVRSSSSQFISGVSVLLFEILFFNDD
jgi:hypothetical protein